MKAEIDFKRLPWADIRQAAYRPRSFDAGPLHLSRNTFWLVVFFGSSDNQGWAQEFIYDQSNGLRRQPLFTGLKPHKCERDAPLPNEIEIEVFFCGICHSDIHQVKNEWGNRYIHACLTMKTCAFLEVCLNIQGY